MIKHIALEVKEKDIKDFYINILKGEMKYQFKLDKKDANQIFNIEHPTNVCYLSFGKFDLELFVKPNKSEKTFNHICIEIEKAQDIFHEAIKRNYWNYLRKNDKTETYFIKDNNENLFELKNI